MPYIQTTTSTTISRKQETEIKERLGQAIALIPGKTERGLMLAFMPETKMYLHGDSTEAMAFVEVSLLGQQPREIVDKLTAELTSIYSTVLAITPKNIYITYRYVADWGCSGINL